MSEKLPIYEVRQVGEKWIVQIDSYIAPFLFAIGVALWGILFAVVKLTAVMEAILKLSR